MHDSWEPCDRILGTAGPAGRARSLRRHLPFLPEHGRTRVDRRPALCPSRCCILCAARCDRRNPQPPKGESPRRM